MLLKMMASQISKPPDLFPLLPPPPLPSQGITFTTAGGASTNVVALRSVGQTGTRITLEVRAEVVTGLYGVAFDLTYPTSLFQLTSRSEGSFLS